MPADSIWTKNEACVATGGQCEMNWVAQGVSIDSRTVAWGDLFIALVGPNMDGHKFLAQAFKRGAVAAVVSQIPEDADSSWPLLMVDDTQTALEGLGVFARDRVGAHICAVTGSVGKTGTKEALRQTLERSGSTHASVASYNNLWGVPLSLARMPRDAAYAIFEIGMNHAGEISPLSRMVRPHVVIVTTVEATHLEYFDGVEGIADAKAEVFDGLEPGGVAILNKDNDQFDRLQKAALSHGARVVSFGENTIADVHLDRLALHPNCSCVSAHIGETQATYKIGMPGHHWATNSLAVLAAVDALGADIGLATMALAAMTAPDGRGRRHRITMPNGAFDLIDDSYNASPVSMRAALHVLAGATVLTGGRRIAVLGEMKELGPTAAHMHTELAADVEAAEIDLVITSGEMMQGLHDALPGNMRSGHCDNSVDAADKAVDAIRPGDVILVKGSLASGMARVVEGLLALEAAPRVVNG
ncbi:MAG: UDP-N-acetylmuramoylalanyl-D-glutamyl-2,6-diaminopimelate--D-alanyl-D-alanine ligase [Alphaproteobacteria bacterium]|jgi:UDP-N-acetylmuramoyl-tripeptide--D-alanyl-D-alanine ligase|nr:UDP-N-acetylmuramoylalanyl-D-glutamyl-2,6-diaminopimelate--D-alanyl-D-alanine ligase [Alphaproteobacteria bacterium]MBT4966941.1 UDP-N-acetylmuramoylalanyl-D-glutamyl-2,6-diaminopimelate--D-alanyl-D-alanine ligase [Alphaproteobacteria bacterium]MBT5160847.1 UDP-N-acetylmuramoylalanyl-D-glutamyl-2,6-diaminopimelate--D-alanyl-D-alanine ligase [Alphaproteobacteria bacterium]MBT6387530.1 UDP-N-acetylmuramoylalanyl-D-glutamyl-2,6-diaminopimelate--D-alanyl-D-alanine ligase [Alphaproteobacteria bact